MKIQVLLFAGACLALVACGKKEPNDSGDAAKAVQTVSVDANAAHCNHAGLAAADAEGTHCPVTQAEIAEAKAKCHDPNCPLKHCAEKSESETAQAD